jgi:hypothetical protein
MPCRSPSAGIVAALRHHKFFSLEELNVAIRELLTKLNNRPFRKRDGSRASVFVAIDKPALKPLPVEPFDLSEWSRARVNIDYHISFDANLYSVPYNLVHELVEIRSTPTTSRSCTKARAWHHTCVVEGADRISRMKSIAPRVIARIWNGRLPAWCTGPNPSARTRRDCSSGL